jgi:threonine dehydrogenase-like Zn-dependent dehydrogenase
VQLIHPTNAIETVALPVTGRAAVLSAPGQFKVEDVLFRAPLAGEVRVKLEGCGVCASNLPLWQGKPWFQYPIEAGAPGHEAWGRVDAIGPKVIGVGVGDRVALLSSNGFADYDLAPGTQVVKLPAALNETPVPAEPLGCAFNIFKRSRISSGEVVAVVGSGFLGCLLTRLARNENAHVIAISRRLSALNFAKEFGAVETIQSTSGDRVKKAVSEFTLGRGCDCVIEAGGTQETLDLATDLTCERGRLIIAGYHQDGPRQVNLQLWNWRGLDVINAHERDPSVYVEGMNEAVSAIRTGVIDPLPLYTHEFGLEDLPQAFGAMRDRPDGFMKALIKL